jgi:hypothetical protein
MAFANSSVTDIIATTIQNRSGELADNVTNNNALLRRLKAKGNVRPFGGGNVILEEIMYTDSTTINVNSYSGYEVLNITPNSPISAASVRHQAVRRRRIDVGPGDAAEREQGSSSSTCWKAACPSPKRSSRTAWTTTATRTARVTARRTSAAWRCSCPIRRRPARWAASRARRSRSGSRSLFRRDERWRALSRPRTSSST